MSTTCTGPSVTPGTLAASAHISDQSTYTHTQPTKATNERTSELEPDGEPRHDPSTLQHLATRRNPSFLCAFEAAADTDSCHAPTYHKAQKPWKSCSLEAGSVCLLVRTWQHD